MTDSLNSKSTRTLVTAAALVAAAGFSALASANISKSYTSPTNNTWYISGLTDFDQRRDFRPANTPIGGLPSGPGLLNGGSMHCVPTATMNNFAYAASHGYPGLQPGDQSYSEWQSQNWFDPYYDALTADLAWLGGFMGTSGTGGTGPSGWWDGANEWVGNEDIDLGMFLASTTWAPRAQHIGQISHNGALTAICYGRYDFNFLTLGGGSLSDRSGGHCVTTRRIDVQNGTNAEYWYRDPGAGDSTWLQSTFGNSVVDMDDGTYTLPGFNARVMSRLSLTTNDGRVRLLDKIYAMWPTQGLTSDPSGSELVAGTLGGFVSPVHPSHDQVVPIYRAPIGERIVGFEQSPMRDETALVVRQTDSSQPTPVDVLRIINNASGDSFSFAIEREMKESGEKSGIQLAWGPEGRLYGVTDTERFVVEKVPVDSDGDGTVDGDDFVLWQRNLGASVPGGPAIEPSDVLFDDESRTFRVLFPTIGEVHCYPMGGGNSRGDLPSEQATLDFDRTWSQNTEFAMDPKSGAMIFADNGPGEIEGWVPCPNGELNDCYVPNTFAPPSGGVGDIVPDGCGGFYLVGLDNIVRCFKFDEAAVLVRKPDAAFDGDVAGGFQITRSRTNYDPAIHAEWGNFPVEEVVAPDRVIVDCAGDVTNTGATLPGQPGFGVPDGVVDLDDLGFFLNAWLAGETVADVTTSGATIEGQAGFGIADGVADLDDLGFYLNAWLVGCP